MVAAGGKPGTSDSDGHAGASELQAMEICPAMRGRQTPHRLLEGISWNVGDTPSSACMEQPSSPDRHQVFDWRCVSDI